MKFEKKKNILTLIIWAIMMFVMVFILNQKRIEYILGFGWMNLIVSGLVVLLLEKFNLIQWEKEVENEYSKNSLGAVSWLKGMEYYKNRDFKKALECFNEAIKNEYIGENVYVFRADCFSTLGLYNEAIVSYEKAISLQPEDCNIYFMRSLTKESMEDLEGAINDIKKAISLSNVKNDLNSIYNDSARKMGWPEGASSIYESRLIIYLNKKEINKMRGEKKNDFNE